MRCEDEATVRQCPPHQTPPHHGTSTVMGSRNGKPVLREEDLQTITSTSGLSEQQIREDFDIFVKARLSRYKYKPADSLTCSKEVTDQVGMYK